jgi:hypothetical protein
MKHEDSLIVGFSVWVPVDDPAANNAVTFPLSRLEVVQLLRLEIIGVCRF